MSETPTTPAPPAPPDKPKATPRASSAPKGGVWVIFDKEGDVVTFHSAEIKALRQASEMGGTVRHVAYGERLDGGK